jgi:hypothetical protein
MWASHKSTSINRRCKVRRLRYDSVSARAGYFYVSRDIKVTWSGTGTGTGLLANLANLGYICNASDTVHAGFYMFPQSCDLRTETAGSFDLLAPFSLQTLIEADAGLKKEPESSWFSRPRAVGEE